MDRSGVFLGSALGQPLGTGAGGGSTTTPASKTYVNGTDFTAGTTTTLTLTSVPFNDACIEIDFDGISQHKTSWTRVSNVITFTSPIPLLTTEVEIHWLVVISAAYTGMNATVDVFSGTGAQLTYSLSGIPISSTVIDCYIGGIYQQKSTYSWNGVQSITFTEAPPIGTNNIEFRWMAASSSVNTPANGSIGPLQMAATTNGPNGSVFLDQYGNMPITDSAYGVIAGGFKNLKIIVTSSTALTLSFDGATLENAGGFAIAAKNQSLNIVTSSTGANTLDTGTIAASSWYSVWAIYNPSTTTVAGLLSLSATSPTLPSGYTYKVRLGWVRTASGSGILIGTLQYGRRVQYVVGGPNLSGLPSIFTGSTGSVSTPTYTQFPLVTTLFVPSTASKIVGCCWWNQVSGNICVAPNNSYGSYTSNTNPPPITLYGTGSSGVFSMQFELLLETMNLYAASNVSSASGVFCIGWEDNI